MLDLLDHQEATHAVLELSSFQLEQSREFAPDLAIWTNLYANHLDRHKTMQAYAAAKAQIFCRQTNGQQALLPLAARAIIEPVIACEPQASKPLHAWFSSNPEPAAPAPENFFYRNTATGAFMYHQRKNTQYILSTEEIPSISFAENWLIIAAAATLLGFDARTFIAGARVPDLPHNRLEPVATVPGITFINDSKSTIIQATIAAIEALAPQSIILLLGGLSKGVDRIPYLGQLRTTGAVRHVICFGAEAQALFAGCQQAGLPASCCATLEEAVTLAYEQARLEQKNTCVLLSPGGTSSYFKNN
jgi:UDP-N-acetylmuramoylalanine--D-glutamate ligase